MEVAQRALFQGAVASELLVRSDAQVRVAENSTGP